MHDAMYDAMHDAIDATHDAIDATHDAMNGAVHHAMQCHAMQ